MNDLVIYSFGFEDIVGRKYSGYLMLLKCFIFYLLNLIGIKFNQIYHSVSVQRPPWSIYIPGEQV